jgi:heavy metal sensor kinase
MASRLPIRWRLTLWYVALLALALALFGGSFYFGLRYLLYDTVDTNLRNHAALVQSAIGLENGQPQVSVGQVLDPANDDQFVRLFSADGDVILDTAADEDDRPANPEGVRAAQAGGSDLRWLDGGDDRLRILTEQVVHDGATVGVLQVGTESDADETLAFARTLIAVAAPLVLLLATGGGLWLAGRALTPIDRITRTAAGIGERDLSRRISAVLPNDEVGRLARTFNAMLDRIEGAFGRQRQFTADAAHELRTPLALMQSQLELALAQPRAAERDQLVLETLAGDVERLSRLSSTLLALARSDARGIELVREPVDLPQLLDLVADQYAALAEAGGVSIAVDAEPVTVIADEDLLLQVLVNLLDNALRHAPRGSVVTLACRQAGASAVVHVADQGAVIAPEHLPHLFERFYRVEPDRDQRRGGIGLGLSICRSIVDAHGGAISVESTPGTGTTIRVELPLR